MKQLHRKDLFGWSVFDKKHNLDFNSLLWVREAGNVLIDPLPMSDHDYEHLHKLGGVNVIITNSLHCRDAEHFVKKTQALVYGPVAEQETFPLVCDRWLHDNEEVFPGLIAFQLNGSKTPGELALLLEHNTLITSELIRCHQGGELCITDTKLGDKKQAIQSVKRMSSMPDIKTVLCGVGWPIFSHGNEALHRLAKSL